MSATYYARDGKVYNARGEEAATAETAKGRDLELHDAALQVARRQREATVTRTRRSLAEQLREALDDMVARDKIESWSADYGAPGVTSVPAKVYTVEHFRSVFGRFVYQFTPGECMDFVNGYGYDVAIGKP